MTHIGKNFLRCANLAFLLTAVLPAAHAQRPGDLIITPTRVVLDDRSKSSDLTLLNRSPRPVRYRLSFVDMDMSRDGQLHRTEGDNPTSAISVLRLSPREIVLAPGVSQRIRIAAFVSSSQADGELRSHLVFEPISSEVPQSTAGQSGTQLQLNLQFRSIVSIPVLVRHGRLGAAATLSDGSIVHQGDTWMTKVTLNRKGNRSVRGDLTATFVSAKGSSKVDLGAITGLAVYCPNADRVVELKLQKDLAKLGPGTITVRFAEPDGSRGSADAKTEIPFSG
jgi:P pilus assembly chaperone PapD